MIKKYLLLFLAFLGIGLSFSNAGYIQQIGIDSRPSYINNDYDLSFLKGGGLLTQFVFQGKSLLAFDNYAYFWWSPNGEPYFYDSKGARTSDDSLQGFFSEYWLCDYFTGNSSDLPVNCTSYSMTGDYKDLFKAFFSRVDQGDYVFYDYEPMSFGTTNYDNTVQVCWSSAEVNKSLCFRQHSCYNGYGCSAYNYGSLRDSQGIVGLKGFLSIPSSWLGYAPGNCLYGGGVCDGNIDNSSGIGENVQLTGNILYKTCTYGKAQQYFEEMGYSPNICYGGLNTFDVLTGGYIAIPRSGKNVFDIYQQLAGYGQSEEDFFNEWLNIYNNAYDGNYYDQVLNGQPTVLRTYFNFYKSYGVFDIQSMLFYCDAYFRNDPDRPLIYSEFPSSFKGDFSSVCNYSSTDNGTLSNSGSAVSVDWSGIGNINSGNNNGNIGTGNTGSVNNTQNIYDGVSFITDYFNKLKSSYSNPSGNSNGILPTYIITFLLAVMLFKFLRK